MARAYLGLGGNIGDVRATIAAAVDRLAARGATVIARSADYGTPPWGKLDQPPYVNACVALETALAPAALLALVLSIEQEFGRRRLEKWGPRTLDIDILTYDDRTVDLPGLVIPHPYMLERAFVVVPLAEIAADLIVKGERVGDVAERIDRAGIERLG
ncbi:2-amino-4-hydroxy-6-hydroxymethyldihydropteridine diphosphokinase [Prosthecomicrobium hirschii]|uniref:2-amino-4-hydroxy-6- hydroxymethyldihydropteridine diphosphokinase n=1 Tax=Prosthecodimorpha hirschii TaxID=665126 RepID=UPI00221E6D90|nr:2-amino-4-hydroxy-6-hydroxymethyldihydropteridine diphosphokinase [Prosthecomicrobium hirschii]MCW1843919.1 2-amino-4-hydroxy-6-hydroxymethyldihydropteridine diphosphokinase [Prosthecomicrobium hirschii]